MINSIHEQYIEKIGNFIRFIDDNINKNTPVNDKNVIIKRFSEMEKDKQNRFIKFVSDEIQKKLPLFRDDIINKYNIIEDSEDLFVNFFKNRDKYSEFYNATLQVFISPIGLFKNDPELIENPDKWMNKTFNEDGLNKIGRYFDLFYTLINS